LPVSNKFIFYIGVYQGGDKKPIYGQGNYEIILSSGYN
jgi:hypothetical protein